jgi:D-tyrosyl-tRNA(Tyr) deacylase
MRAILQRVKRGSVTVNGQRVAEIGPGLVVLVGVGHADTVAQADWMAEKVANLRIFEDAEGKMNRSVLETGGSVLVVSQFTLYANAEKGRRPSFIEAAAPEHAEPLVAHFADRLKSLGVPVQTGVFRAEMLVEIHNDGPVTIVLEK